MEDNIKIRENFLQAQVCSSQSWDEALNWLQANSPAGTELNWQKDERPEVAPVRCKDHPERWHYVFVC